MLTELVATLFLFGPGAYAAAPTMAHEVVHSITLVQPEHGVGQLRRLGIGERGSGRSRVRTQFYWGLMGTEVRRVIPGSLYDQVLREMREWQKKMRDGGERTRLACREPLAAKRDSKPLVLCLDRLSAKNRDEFFAWYQRRTDY